MRKEQLDKWLSRDIYVFLLMLCLGLLEYALVLDKGFASDDFSVLYRIIHQNSFLQSGFFRPFSDISLYACYLIGGLHPFVYNLFNILLHISSAFLLFKIATGYLEKEPDASAMGVAAALLFLCYPFHNESIVWVVGRASNLSCFLGFLSLYVALGQNNLRSRLLFSALLYFVAMSTYETVTPLPGIVLVLLYKKEHPYSYYLKWVLAFSLALALNLGLRLAISGNVVGEYGSRIFDPSIPGNLLKFAKTFGRLWLPPMQSATILVMLTSLVGAVLLVLSRRVMTQKNIQSVIYSRLLMAFCLSCIVPFLFGLSTRTIEGDRVLYFPSFFLAFWLAYSGKLLIRKTHQFGWLLGVLAYWIIFLEINNYTWTRADAITRKMVHALIRINQEDLTGSRKIILNIPEEYKGAHVLRNGLYDAVLLNGGDTSGIDLAGFQGPSENALQQILVKPVRKDSLTWFGDYAAISNSGILWLPVKNTTDTLKVQSNNQDLVYYWNNHDLVRWR